MIPNHKGQTIEIIRFKVAPEKVQLFLEKRHEVDAFVKNIAGYEGVKIMSAGNGEWILMVHWSSAAALQEAQKITATAETITNWIQATTEKFLSFESVTVEYLFEVA